MHIVCDKVFERLLRRFHRWRRMAAFQNPVGLLWVGSECSADWKAGLRRNVSLTVGSKNSLLKKAPVPVVREVNGRTSPASTCRVLIRIDEIRLHGGYTNARKHKTHSEEWA